MRRPDRPHNPLAPQAPHRPNQSLNRPSHRPPEWVARASGFRLIAGVDEAGRGPWAGPVVAAAVVLRSPIRQTRIDDSKQLTPRQREHACARILRHADVGVGIVSAEEIDRENILQATLLAMRRAIADLPNPPQLVLVDGPISPHVSIPCWPIVHGDALSRPIACASIVAKVTRDRLMKFYHRLMPAYAFDEHKGYGTLQHRLALTRWGPSFLHRISFRPIQSIVHSP